MVGFDELVERTLELLRRRGRVSYTALRLEHGADDAVLEALRAELVDVLGVADDVDGRLLALRAPPPAAPATGPERRLLTVLLCDLVDSTPLAEALDAEDLSAVMTRYHAICKEVIDRHDGHVSQWIGDGVDVYFGFPRVHEDDASRAVRCGWDLVQAIAAANADVVREHGVPLAVRVGVNTGSTVVGGTAADSRGGTLAFGDTPNIAARVQALATPGTVTVSDRTHAATATDFVYEALGPHRLKGIAKPVALFRVVEPLPEHPRFAVPAGRGLSSLVGRAREGARLRAACEEARAGRPAAVLLSGEAGIGKSRLVHGVREAAVADFGLSVAEGQCSPYHSGSALHPIVSALRTLWPAAGAIPAARPLLASLLGYEEQAALHELSSQRQREETLTALVETLAATAASSPFVLAVEDLHWVDPSTIELLGRLLGTPGLLLVLTARPELSLPFAVDTIELEPLDPVATLQLIRASAAEPLGPARVRALAERAGGVPLFAEELARGADSDGDIPTTLYGCLMARIDRDPGGRAVAQLAAAIGRDFERPLLEAVGELSPTTLAVGLERLEADGLIEATGPETHRFRHALIQEAAVGSLLRDRRRVFHGRIADALVERFPDVASAHPERVARYYAGGGRAGEAIARWKEAGLGALERSENQEAAAHFGHALELVGDLAPGEERDRAELGLRVLAALPIRATRGWSAPEVVENFERAEELCATVENAPELFPTIYGLITYRLVSGHVEDAVTLGAAQVAVVEEAGDSGLVLEAESVTGNALIYLGRFDEGLRRLERVLELHDPEAHADHLVHFGLDPRAVTLVHVAMVQAARGEVAARATVGEAIASARAAAHPFSEAWAAACAALVEMLLGDDGSLRGHAETAIAISAVQGFPNWAAQAQVYLGWAVARDGERARGLSLLREGIDAWEATGTVLMAAYFDAVLADVLRESGNPAGALAAADRGLALAARTGDRWLAPELHRARAEALRDLGRGSDAIGAARAALDIAASTGAHGLAGRAQLTLRGIGDGACVA